MKPHRLTVDSRVLARKVVVLAFLMSLGGCVRIGRPGESPPENVRGGRADVHLHLSMHSALPFFQGEVDGPILARSPDEIWVNQVTTHGLHAAGISLVFAALWPPFALRPGRSAMDETLGQVRRLHDFMDEHSGFAIASSAQDARELVSKGLFAKWACPPLLSMQALNG